MGLRPVEVNVQSSTNKPTASAPTFNEEMYRVPETINFPEEEEKILKFWGDNKVFEKCLQQSKGKPK